MSAKFLERVASGGVKHATKAPATERAATDTGFRRESDVREEAEDSEMLGEYGTRSGVDRPTVLLL